MRRNIFFVEDVLRDESKVVVTQADLLHQWRNVFRFHPGSELLLADNSGFFFHATITSLHATAAEISIQASERAADETPVSLVLAPALLKKDKMEWVIQKGTELGVTRFAPLLSRHAEKKSLNMTRVVSIAREACEQCGRGIIPTIDEPREVADFVAQCAAQGIVVCAFDGGGKEFFGQQIQKDYAGKKVALLIGPEGGWSDDERLLFSEKNVLLYTLGKRTLRAETAAIAGVALALLN